MRKKWPTHPAVVARALEHAEAVITRSRSADQRETLEADLANTETAVRRLTAAIIAGGELGSLVTALQTYERSQEDLRTRLEAIRAPQPTWDSVTVRRTLEGYLHDWQGLLRGHVHQGQQVLRRLIVGRLTFAPTEDGYYTFSGTGTVQPLLGGVVRKWVSPTGSVKRGNDTIQRDCGLGSRHTKGDPEKSPLG